jgi:hypothetical protein
MLNWSNGLKNPRNWVKSAKSRSTRPSSNTWDVLKQRADEYRTYIPSFVLIFVLIHRDLLLTIATRIVLHPSRTRRINLCNLLSCLLKFHYSTQIAAPHGLLVYQNWTCSLCWKKSQDLTLQCSAVQLFVGVFKVNFIGFVQEPSNKQ